MSGAVATTSTSWRSLDYLPVSLFGSVMGLTVLSFAWRLAHTLFGVPEWLADGIGAVAAIAFVLIAAAYAVKLVSAFDAARAEFRHPIAGNLFGTFPISLLLLPAVIAPVSQIVAKVMWVAGAICMLVFTWIIVNRWMSDRQQVAHATPAWFLPVVGMLDLPLALPALSLPPMRGVMVLGLAVGLFFTIPLFTLIFSRILFEPPMPDSLQPTLLILVAPFAVGFSTYVVTTGQVDLLAQSLYALNLFMLAVLMGRLFMLPVCCPFRVSWWAVSFPLAATAVAALRIAAAQPSLLANALAIALLSLATLIIVWLLVRTLMGVIRGELRTLSN